MAGASTSALTATPRRPTPAPRRSCRWFPPTAAKRSKRGRTTPSNGVRPGSAEPIPSALIDAGSNSGVDNWLFDSFGLSGETGQQPQSGNQTIDTSGVTNPAPQSVYQTYLTSSSTGKIAYQLPVANGTYTIRLHFADFAGVSPGQRKFDIKLQGATVVSNFDIVATAGGGGKATTQTFTVTASGGQGIRLDLVAPQFQTPLLNAIELSATTRRSLAHQVTIWNCQPTTAPHGRRSQAV